MEADMEEREKDYLVDAGVPEYEASFLISLEEKLVSNKSDKI